MAFSSLVSLISIISATHIFLACQLFQPTLSIHGRREQEPFGTYNDATSLCKSLSNHHPLAVHLPHTPLYKNQQLSYFSAQQVNDYQPACRISPTSAAQVSLTIRTLVAAVVPFVIKSGGHSYVPGLSNIDGNGITIDLSSLSSITVSADKSTVSIGVGARWTSVYHLLESHGLSVAGARAGTVGAGGFLLGGGLSWLSSQDGWSCDSVEEFEVVMHCGRIVLANAISHKDLFWALKGGGGSFGIVTRFRMRTVPIESIYGGAVAYESFQAHELIEALVTMNDVMDSRSTASGFLTFASTSKNPQATMSTAYIVELEGKEDSRLLRPFRKIPNFWTSLRTMNMSDAAAEMSEDEPRMRRVKFTLTLHSDVTILKTIYDVFVAFAGPFLIESRSADLVAITFQPLSSSHLSGRDNPFGFSSLSMPLMLLSFDVRWTSPAEDTYMEEQARSVYADIMKRADKMRSLHRFVYMNYAARWQSPWDGYGGVSKRRLQSIRERYDPDEVFTRKY